VLMIASRRKTEQLRAVMRVRSVEESQLARLQAPAGPDAGAKTPGEIALVAIVGVLALLRGRGASPMNVGQDMSKPNSLAAPFATATEGKFINPVCGMAVSTVNPLHIETYEGVSYYFCCDGCRTTFLRDPAKYAEIRRASVAGVPT
jgi:xanthine dehydrogenase accessory factor